EVVAAVVLAQHRPLDDARLPRRVVLLERRPLADEVQPVRRESLRVDVRRRSDRVAVVLPEKVELAVVVAERARVDRAAERRLADERLLRRVDERAERLARDSAPDALVRRVVEDIRAVVALQHLRRPCLADESPRAELPQRVLPGLPA